MINFGSAQLQQARAMPGATDDSIKSYLMTDPDMAKALTMPGANLDNMAAYFDSQQPMSAKVLQTGKNMLSAGAQSALNSIPGMASVNAAKASPVNRVSAGLSDASGALMAAATGGLSIPVAAATNAAVEGSGIGPLFRGAASYLDKKIPEVAVGDMVRNPDPNGPKFINRDKVGDYPAELENFVGNLPKNILTSAVELAPQAAAAWGAGKLSSSQAKPSQTPATTAMLEKNGGTPPPSAYVNSPLASSLFRGVERAARTNPITEGMVQNLDQNNVEAVSNFVSKKVPGASLTTGASGGQSLIDAVTKANAIAKAKYQAIMDQVRNVPYVSTRSALPPDAPPAGQVAATQLKGLLNTNDFIPDEAKELIQDTAARIAKNGTTPGKYDAEIKRFNYENQKLLQANPGPGVSNTLDHYFSQANDILKNTHYDYLNKLQPPLMVKGKVIQPGLGDQLQATNFDYATAKGDLFGPFAQMAGGKIEDLPKKMLTAGTEFRAAAKQNLGPGGYKTLQDQALAELFRQATDSQGNLNANQLQTLYGKRYKGMDWSPGQKSTVENVLGMMKAAGLGTLNAENPSGTAGTASKIAHTTALLSGVGTVPELLASAGEAALMKAPVALKTARAVGNFNIPNTPVVPPQLYGMRMPIAAVAGNQSSDLKSRLIQNLQGRVE